MTVTPVEQTEAAEQPQYTYTTEQLDELKRVLVANTRNRWAIGDLLLQIVPAGSPSDGRLNAVMDELSSEADISVGYLSMCRSISMRWPEDFRGESIRWAAFYELSKIPGPDRYEVFRSQRHWTAAEARMAVARWREQNSAFGAGDDEVSKLERYLNRAVTTIDNASVRADRLRVVDRFQLARLTEKLQEVQAAVHDMDTSIRELSGRNPERKR